jgi:hypothetical protein
MPIMSQSAGVYAPKLANIEDIVDGKAVRFTIIQWHWDLLAAHQIDS